MNAVDHRLVRWTLFVAFGVAVSISSVWDGRRAGEIAGALFGLAFVGLMWMLAPRDGRYQATYAALCVCGLVGVGLAITGTELPSSLSIAFSVVCLCGLALAVASLVRIVRLLASASGD